MTVNNALGITDAGIVYHDGAGTFAGNNLSAVGNTIASTDTNGNINLIPDGSGYVRVANSLVVGDGADPNTITISGASITCNLASHTEGVTDLGDFCSRRHSDIAALGSNCLFARSRGDASTPTIVQDGDLLSQFVALGHDGTDFAISSAICFEVDNTPGAGDMPGRIIFKTSQDGTESATEAVRIDSSQVVTLANALTVANGGTGASTLTDHSVLVGSGTGAVTALTVGTDGQVLLGSSAADPVFATLSSSDSSVTFATGAGTLGLTVTQAGESQLGGAEIATQAEVTTGTDDTRFMTPLKHVTSLASPPAIGLTASAASAFTTVGIGTTTVPHASVGAGIVALDGANASGLGPHFQVTTASDDYPVFMLLNWRHDDIELMFDCFYNHATSQNLSSDAGSNFRLRKHSDSLKMELNSGVTAGDVVTFTTAFELNSDGILTLPLQSKFLAYNSTTRTNVTGDGTTVTLQCDTEIYDQNADYNTTTYTYTCPATSKCSFGYAVRLEGLEAASRADNSIVTSNSNFTFQEIAIGVIKDNGSSARVDGHVECDMDAADTASILIIVGGGTKVVDFGTTANNTRFYGGIIA